MSSIEDLQKYGLGIYHVKDQLRQWVYDRSEAAFKAGDRARDEIRTTQELEARRTFMREKWLESAGGLPSSDHPLSPVITGTVNRDGYRIEKIIFQSRPSTYVTSNMYIPDDLNGPSAAVLFLCGHSDNGKQYDTYQTVCQRLVAEGLIVFAIDPIGQGERLSYYDPATGKAEIRPGTSDHEYAGSQSIPLGDGLARYFIHDAIRAVDYLCTRPEIDPARIGVTGNSGGGLQTSLVMLCDPRIAAAAPGTFIMNRSSYLYSGQAQDAEQVWRGMSKLGFDHEDLLIAMAPRPVLVLAVTSDFFPIEGTRRTVARTKRFWEMYGVNHSPGIAEDRSTHAYTRPLADAAAEFFAKHLSVPGRDTRKEIRIELLGQAELDCTKSGQVRGDYADARAVYEENGARLDELERRRAALSEETLKSEALGWLKERVYGGRERCELNPRFLRLNNVESLAPESYLWWSQEGLFNHGVAFRDERFDGKQLPVSIGLWERGTTVASEKLSWIKETCAQGKIAFVLDVSGDGICAPSAISPYSIWSRFGTLHKLTADLFWLDDSLVAVRAYDVIRALDMAEQLPDAAAERVELYAEGRYALYAELAAALDERIGGLHIGNGPDSVASWVRSRHYDPFDLLSTILPGMLRYFDLPDLRRWRNR
ncbi:alpha/beta hydrolase family protein [Paenibacillus sp. GCM10012303]|uniref:alpha/beta hydrolase family protein n=1 Tax=Paenibacillus sp. GCM10012303 TaxID=3317340 RepID=UPI003616BF39